MIKFLCLNFLWNVFSMCYFLMDIFSMESFSMWWLILWLTCFLWGGVRSFILLKLSELYQVKKQLKKFLFEIFVKQKINVRYCFGLNCIKITDKWKRLFTNKFLQGNKNWNKNFYIDLALKISFYLTLINFTSSIVFAK